MFKKRGHIHFEFNPYFIKHFFDYYFGNVFALFGASICIIGNFGLFLLCLYLRDLILLDELNQTIEHMDRPLLISLILCILLFLSMIVFLFSNPGYVEKKSIKD